MTASETSDRHSHRFWHDGRVVTITLASLAFMIYMFGFRSASFPWIDAIGAAFAHVAPGAVAGITAWRLQSWVRRKSPLWLTHGFLAVATGLFWLAMMLAVTYAAKPDIVMEIAQKAGLGTFFSGIILYAAIAFVFTLTQARQRAAESEAARARAELAAVRARVEPHFLYNTLETIAGLVRQDPAAAENAIGRLGRMLRRVLDAPTDENGDPLVPLQEELTLVRDYLAIEQLRLGERLTIIDRIDDDTRDLGVPALGLQVLVENAIVHGIAGKSEGGTISLTAARHGNELVLMVADDGVGAEESRVASGGLGIGLLRKRLDTQFPGKVAFDVAASPGHGVSVRLSFPAIEVE